MLFTPKGKKFENGPLDHEGEYTPVWIPRNGKDDNGNPFVVLTCTECLNRFRSELTMNPPGVLKTPCLYCPREITYIIDFSHCGFAGKEGNLEGRVPENTGLSRK